MTQVIKPLISPAFYITGEAVTRVRSMDDGHVQLDLGTFFNETDLFSYELRLHFTDVPTLLGIRDQINAFEAALLEGKAPESAEAVAT